MAVSRVAIMSECHSDTTNPGNCWQRIILNKLSRKSGTHIIIRVVGGVVYGVVMLVVDALRCTVCDDSGGRRVVVVVWAVVDGAYYNG